MALDDIYVGIEEHRMLIITYTSQKNETTTRTVEPIEVKNGLLFAWDIQKDQIRCFFLAMLNSVELTDIIFIPRF